MTCAEFENILRTHIENTAIPKPIPTFTHNTYTPKNSNSHTNQLNNHSNFSILA